MMRNKMIAFLILVLVLVSGCSSLENGICVEGNGIKYDGESASGKLKIIECESGEVINDVDLVNESVAEIDMLPILEVN